MIVMNQAWKDLITKVGLPTVPAAEKIGTFYELVCGNYDFMVNGNAEGLIVVNPSFGSSVHVSKWKIGAEANSSNQNFLENMLKNIEEKGELMFGLNAAKAKDLFEKLYDVAKSLKKV